MLKLISFTLCLVLVICVNATSQSPDKPNLTGQWLKFSSGTAGEDRIDKPLSKLIISGDVILKYTDTLVFSDTLVYSGGGTAGITARRQMSLNIN